MCHAEPTSIQKTQTACVYKKQHAWYLDSAGGATCATTQSFDAQSPFSISTACTCRSACPDMLTCTRTVHGTCWSSSGEANTGTVSGLGLPLQYSFKTLPALQLFSIKPRLPVLLLCAARHTCGSFLPEQLCCSRVSCSDHTSMRQWSCNTNLDSSAPAVWIR